MTPGSLALLLYTSLRLLVLETHLSLLFEFLLSHWWLFEQLHGMFLTLSGSQGHLLLAGTRLLARALSTGRSLGCMGLGEW